VAPLAREWVEEVEGLSNHRFEAADGWENTGGRPATGAQAARPWNAAVQRLSGLGEEEVVLGRS
jgi:hypothetical protein